MRGLLGTSIDDPRTMATLQLAQGLLGGGGTMQRLSGGLLGYTGTMNAAKKEEEERRAKEEQRQMQMQMQQAQLQQMQAAQAQQAAAQQRQQAIEGAYRGAIRTPEQQAMQQNRGPTMAAAQAAPGMSPTLDQGALIRGLMQADPMAAAQMLQPKETEIKEYREIRMPDGSVQVVGFGKDGKPVQTGQVPFKAPEVRDFGGFVGGVDPITGQMNRIGDKTQTPDSRANNAVQIRGQNMTDARAREMAQEARENRMVTVMDPLGNAVSLPASQAAGMPAYNAAASAQIRKQAESQKARGQLATTLGELKSYYDDLRTGGGIVSQESGTVGNLMARTSSTALGQTLGGAVGTRNQQARDKIEQTRPLLLNLIKEATGMSAQQMNSNAEMQLYLRAATDPKLSYEANVQALNNLDALFGNGKGVVSRGGATGTWGDEPAGGVWGIKPLGN